jgi:AraC-like DNA-binding protein
MSFKRKHPTTISTWAAAVIQAMENLGFDPEQMIQRSGLDKSLLSDPDARIKIEDMSRLWKIAVEVTGDECFGLTAAANVKPTTFHALGFAIMVSRGLMDAFERLRRFYRIVSDSVEVKFIYKEDLISISFNPYEHLPQPSDEAFDMAMASIVAFAKMLTNTDVNPVKVELRRKEPANPEKFINVFGSTVVFCAENNQIFYTKKDMQKPLPSANAEIARRNDLIVVDYLASFDEDLMSHKVHAKLIELLPLGEPSCDKLAKSMGLSTRSLHRCLKKENVAYREILNDIRKTLAARYLKQPTFSIIEIAFQLGYSDSSNFTRAFKRWFGISPRKYRKKYNDIKRQDL